MIVRSIFSLHRTLYDNERGETIGESIIQTNAAKFRACDKFVFKCGGCKTENIIAKPYVKVDNDFIPVLKACANKECHIAPIHQLHSIRNQLALAMRKAIRNYYANWMICDEPNCNQSTRTVIHVSLMD